MRSNESAAATMPPETAVDQDLETQRRLQAQFEKLEKQFALLKEQTRQVQKLASLGTAAAMLAHEFNNLMTPMVGYARYALDSGDNDLMAKALRMTLKQADALTAMSDRILGLAVNEAQSYKPAPVKEVVEEAVACLCRDLSKDGIKLTAQIDDTLKVLADAKQLRQVFFNLLINARQAITHRSGRIDVTAERANEEQVVIRVADNGCGISPELGDAVFEPFVSTKRGRPDKSGAGLGLSLCREIIEEHRGRITFESKLNVGTTFIITLPAAD
jgi:signal transduction histidine kinase